MKVLKLFIFGLLISLIGSLPLGTLNVATFKIAASSGQTLALWFAIGCVIVEVVYVRISLTAMEWVSKNEKIMKFLKFMVLFITVALAIASFLVAFRTSTYDTNQFELKSIWSAFLLGIAMSAINPAQIPFWFGFSAMLQSKQILLPIQIHYNIYMIAIAVGSMFASFIFIYAGRFMVDKIGDNHFMINMIVGACFSIAALFQLFRIFWKKKRKEDASESQISA